MPLINTAIFLTGLLLLLGIASSKLSARFGMPVLVLFLGVGMLAGSEGPGGIPFENYGIAYGIGSMALALILFDGGLRTSLGAVRSAWQPALTLSTVGVLLTAALTGLTAAWVLGLPVLHGLLLGGIVGSTDAAAVFSVLRSSGLKLPERLGATLEVESGSNDPMAIFLTLGLVGLVAGTADSAGQFVLLFVLQFGVGGLVGVGVGRAAAWIINRINLDAAGLYPVLALAAGLLAFGLAAMLEGSGFLAVYLAGIVLGNSRLVFQRGISFFHDAAAWLGQIVLFVMLGLLSFPSRLLSVGSDGLLIALVLIFVARPLAVAASVLPFRFRWREVAFLSWGGLKGAVPITLATLPLLGGIAEGGLLFNVVFFVVLVSALVQGWSLPLLARWLGIGRPADLAPPLSVEIHALRHLEGDIVKYTVTPSARVAGQALRDLAFPDAVALTLVVRGEDIIVPRGATVLCPGDHVFVAMRTRLKPLVDRLFDPDAETPPLAPHTAITFDAQSTLGQLHRFFGFPELPESVEPVGKLLEEAEEGQPLRLGPFIVARGDDQEFVTLTCAPELASASAPDADEEGTGEPSSSTSDT